jgi:hypothetical protein
MRVTAIRIQTPRERLNRSARRAEKRRKTPRMTPPLGLRCPKLSGCTRPGAVQSGKRLIAQLRQGMLMANGRPPEECRYTPRWSQTQHALLKQSTVLWAGHSTKITAEGHRFPPPTHE